MTDKEKIEQIMKLRGLNNTQFADLIGISPGTLSHIMSERTKPTLQILRSIKFVCPDINPGWLFYDDGPMMISELENESDSPINNNEEQMAQDPAFDGGYDLFSGLNQQYPQSSNNNGVIANKVQNTAGVNTRSGNINGNQHQRNNVSDAQNNNVNNVLHGSSTSYGIPSSYNVQDVVAETVKQMNKPQRKIVEVRIFFDDGTFEVFASK